MIPKQIEELLKNAKPLETPKVNQKIRKSCSNCMDYIVCWAYGKIIETDDEEQDKIKNIERANNCSDWHLDFMEYQKMIEEAEEQEDQ